MSFRESDGGQEGKIQNSNEVRRRARSRRRRFELVSRAREEELSKSASRRACAGRQVPLNRFIGALGTGLRRPLLPTSLRYADSYRENDGRI